MKNSNWSPSVVVGIDFGMTCTGVAYSSTDSGWAPPQVIQDWPHHQNVVFNKYPSRVAYNRANRLVDWGTCTLSREKIIPEKEFKLFLDPSFCEGPEDGLSHDDAVKHYINYMTKLNEYVNGILMQRFSNWNDRNVEYRFSTPTTWKSPWLTNQLKKWLAEAGFLNTSKRRIVFSQTEAEAAAVYVATYNQLQRGDVIMVVDAGGATTDLNTLEVTKQNSGIIQMQSLDKAEGINIGSVMIDTEVRNIIENRLRALSVRSDYGLKWLAEKMMEESRFDLWKSDFGNDDSVMNFHMNVPGKSERQVELEGRDVKAIFDTLTNSLISNIRKKIESLAQSHPYQDLRYIILSGGLGSSKYIKKRLTEEFGTNNSSTANKVEVWVTPDPQLAVVKGLVMDRSQTLGQDVSVWAGRCCRVSYGVVCKLRYDSSRHAGETMIRDPATGALWVEGQIDWFIKEGENVPDEGISRRYSLRVNKQQEVEPFYAQIVMSELPATLLPNSKQRGPVQDLCIVEGTFLPGDLAAAKKKRVFGWEKKANIVHLNLRVTVGSTDIEFELESVDGRTYSDNPSKVKVHWDEVKSRGTVSQPSTYSMESGSNPSVSRLR